MQVFATVEACGPGEGVAARCRCARPCDESECESCRSLLHSRRRRRLSRVTATGVRLSPAPPPPVFSIGDSPAAADVDHLYLLAPDPSLEK